MVTTERIRKTKDVQIFGKDLDFRERLSSPSVEPFNINKQFTSLPGNGELSTDIFHSSGVGHVI